MKHWKMANLEPLKRFLIAERNASRYMPTIPYGLED